ncbi:MAG: AsmA family protein [Proteobacteria bacterium]|nr:AsmA family protein [Pseudomonadota bacterium]
MKIALSGFSRSSLKQALWRVLIGIGAVFLLALAIAGVLVMRVDFVGAEQAALARLEQDTGLRIIYAARKEARFPSPHVTYQGLSVTRAGVELLKARRADLRFSLIDLIDGELDFPALSLQDAVATIDHAMVMQYLRSPRSLLELAERLPGLFEHQSAVGRLSLTIDAGRLTLKGADGVADAELGPLALALEYSADRGRLAARLTQAGSGPPGKAVPLAQEQIKLAVTLPTRTALSKGRGEAARIEAHIGDSSLLANGTLKAGPDLAFSGKVEASLGDAFDRLLGLPSASPRSDKGEAGKLDADMTMDARGIGLDNLKIAVGRRSVTGIAALREVNERWSISATLGGDLVDGTAAHRVLQGVRDEKGGWSKAPLNLNPLPQIDLDLRLSSKAFRLGRFALNQVALSVFTRATRAEMAIVDSRFGEGSFKARVVVGEGEGGGQTLKISASGENVESGELLEQAFGFDRMTGLGSFVIQALGQGTSVATLMASLNGTAAFDIKDGIVNGIDLTRLMNRAADQRAETALLFSLVGKTSFEALRADFALRDGRLETVGSRFLTKTADAVMEGYSDIGLQQHHQSVVLRKRGDGEIPQGEFFGFRMEGPLFSPSIKPDQRLLQDKR